MQSTTRDLNELLLNEAKAEQGNFFQRSWRKVFSCCKKENATAVNNNTWLNFQFAKNILKTFIETGFTTAFLVTDGFGLEATFYEMSYYGIGLAIPMAIYFSLCESYCHDTKSQLVDRNDAQVQLADLENQISVTDNQEEIKLTCKQHILAKGHFASDIFSDVETLLMPTKIIFGMKTWHPGYRALAYAGFGLFGFLGNVEEYKNSVTAFLDANKVNARRIVNS